MCLSQSVCVRVVLCICACMCLSAQGRSDGLCHCHDIKMYFLLQIKVKKFKNNSSGGSPLYRSVLKG